MSVGLNAGLLTRNSPFLPIRLALSSMLFAEAGLLAYLLITRFPPELHACFALTAVSASLSLLTQLRVKPGERRRLNGILARLKGVLGLGLDLRVVWMPGASTTLSGEVRDKTIYIYESDFRKAVETLIEEYIEYAIYESSRPYVEMLNAIVKSVNEQAYRQRDKLAKALTKILKSITVENCGDN